MMKCVPAVDEVGLGRIVALHGSPLSQFARGHGFLRVETGNLPLVNIVGDGDRDGVSAGANVLHLGKFAAGSTDDFEVRVGCKVKLASTSGSEIVQGCDWSKLVFKHMRGKMKSRGDVRSCSTLTVSPDLMVVYASSFL